LVKVKSESLCGKFKRLVEEPTLDPVENLRREVEYMRHAPGPSFRVWRNSDCVVLGRFLRAEDEVHLEEAECLGVPVLKRVSGGGAVFHDPGNLNYSLYLEEVRLPVFGVEASLQALSFPVTRLLEAMGLPWEWAAPNSIYVSGRKVSGSAQARSRGRILHHGTLLVGTDLIKMERLLKEGGRSRTAPVMNLDELVPGMTVARAEAGLRASFESV
jgi:lipoate---protein ligase